MIVAGGLAGLLVCKASVEAVSDVPLIPCVAPSGSRFPCGLLCSAGRRLLANTAKRGGAVRCFLPFGRARVWRRPRGAAVAAQRGCRTRRVGFPTASSFPDTGRRKRCLGRCSLSRLFSGRSQASRRGEVAGAVLALLAIFIPGMLCLVGFPFWSALSADPRARAAMLGTNAAVVGLLGAALYNPVWTSAVQGPLDFAIAAAGFVLLIAWRAPAAPCRNYVGACRRGSQPMGVRRKSRRAPPGAPSIRISAVLRRLLETLFEVSASLEGAARVSTPQGMAR